MTPRRKNNQFFSDWRLGIIFISFALSFVLIILKLFTIQILSHEKYKSMAHEQYIDQRVIPSSRGTIFSSDGYVLAGTQFHYLMYSEPKKVKDPYQLASDISNILVNARFKEEKDVDNEKLKKEMLDKYFQTIYSLLTMDLTWVSLDKDLTSHEKELIEKALLKDIEGIGFEEIPVRYYPEGVLAGHVLGFVGSDEDGEKTGYFGIEGSLNNDLKGKPGRLMEETDALGIPILMGNYKKIESVQGRDIKLTINRAVQYLVEKKLKEGVEKYNAKLGSIIVMEPFTGKVIAMANYPNFNPLNFAEEGKIDEKSGRLSNDQRSHCISTTYEPGSVMKPLTVSAAVDLKIVEPTTTFNDEGPVRYSDYVINNWDGKHHGVQTIIELLQKSNNIGAAWVGHQVGKENLYKYFSNFGIGLRTNIDLEGEDSGILRGIQDWTDIDLATASFGQGLSVTPLQILNAFNAIANGGYLLQPKIIEEIKDNKTTTEIPVKVIRRVITKETSDTMVDLLEKAAEGGEAKYFYLKDYRISGKTGTAQIPEGGKYSPDRTNATFLGFMTGSKAFSMIVKLEEPKTSVYAAETAAPLWMDIATNLVKFYSLPPDRSIPENTTKTQ